MTSLQSQSAIKKVSLDKSIFTLQYSLDLNVVFTSFLNFENICVFKFFIKYLGIFLFNNKFEIFSNFLKEQFWKRILDL